MLIRSIDIFNIHKSSMKNRDLLCIIFLVLLIAILLSINIHEGYEEAVPNYCGTAGLKLTNGLMQFLKNMYKADIDKIKKQRFYTPSECDKLDSGVINKKMYTCYKLKDDKKKNDISPDNIDINYSDKCGGLNRLNSPPPSECMADERVLGKMNKAFSQTINGTTIVIDNNAFRYYTKSECEKLNGQYINMIESMKNQNSKQEEIDNFIKVNGKEYGTCNNGELQLSWLCGTDEAPTATKEIADVVKKNMKSWLD